MAVFVWASALAGNWSTGANWQVGGVAQVSPPTATDDVLFGSGTGATNSNCTIDAASTARSVDFTGYTGTLAHNNFVLFIGDSAGGTGPASNIALKMVSTMTYAPAAARQISFISTGNNSGSGWTVTWGTKQPGTVVFNGIGGKWVQQDRMTNISSTAGGLTITGGAYDSGNQIIDTPAYTSTGTNVRSTTFGTSTINLIGVGTVWNLNNTPNVTASSTTINLTGPSITNRTFNTNGVTFGTINYTIAGSTGSLVLNSGCTIDTLNFSDITNARSMTLANGTFTFNNFNVNGTSGKLMTVRATTAASTTCILTKSGTGIWSCDFLTVTDIKMNDAYTFYAGANSTATGTSINIITTAPDTIQRRQTAYNTTAPGTSVVATYGAATVSGNLLVACWNATAAPSTTTAPSGWTQAVTGTNGNVTTIWYKVADGTETTVTVSQVNSVNVDLFIAEITGFSGTPTLDVTDNNSTAGATTLSTTATTGPTNTTATAFAVAHFGFAGGTSLPTATNSYEVDFKATGRTWPLFKPLSATAAQSTTLSWTTSRSAVGELAVFKGVAAATSGGTLLLMGAG